MPCDRLIQSAHLPGDKLGPFVLGHGPKLAARQEMHGAPGGRRAYIAEHGQPAKTQRMAISLETSTSSSREDRTVTTQPMPLSRRCAESVTTPR